MKVLIVDDNPDDRKVLRYMAEGHGLEVVEAEDGMEGLQKVIDDLPDLIISDVLMPEMDGFQFLWWLRKEPQFKTIPFVFYSASFKGEEDIRLAESLGANAYLIKPLDPNEIWSKIKDLLDEEKLAPSLSVELPEEDSQFLKHYGRVVATKLEKKVRELERTLEERSRVEETLRESQKFIRNILDSVGEGFLVIDRDYKVISVNRAFCEMVNLPEEQTKGRLCHELLRGAFQPCFESGRECPVRGTFETGKPYSVVHSYDAGGGNLSHIELRSFPITDDAGGVVSVIEIINDITEKRRIEEQLNQTQKLESIGQLAGGVAHDFNNMLAVILGRTQLIMRKLPAQDPLQGNLQAICNAAEHSADLTRQLLAFARKQVITPRRIDLNEAVEETLKMLRRLIGEDIELDWVPAIGSMPLLMDPIQLDQVLANLCVNARDAIGRAGRIIIRTQFLQRVTPPPGEVAGQASGEYVVLAVSDNGQGIDAAILPRIFEPFFTTKKIGRGTGLGLATVYGIVKQNNGFIEVTSEPQQGTTFKIFLPRHKESAAPHLPKAQEGLPPACGKETILLVEDEPSILDITQQMLEECGYRVLAAVSPDNALTLARQGSERIDLLMTDVVMPGMNGRELRNQLAAETPRLKCLYMSGYPTDVIARHGALEEGVHFLQKPFSFESLAEKVRMALGDSPVRSGS